MYGYNGGLTVSTGGLKVRDLQSGTQNAEHRTQNAEVDQKLAAEGYLTYVKPQTSNPLYTLHSTLYTLHSTLCTDLTTGAKILTGLTSILCSQVHIRMKYKGKLDQR